MPGAQKGKEVCLARYVAACGLDMVLVCVYLISTSSHIYNHTQWLSILPTRCYDSMPVLPASDPKGLWPNPYAHCCGILTGRLKAVIETPPPLCKPHTACQNPHPFNEPGESVREERAALHAATLPV